MNERFGACTQLAGECSVCPKMSTLNVSIVVARANGKSLSQLEMLDRLMKRRTIYENR